MPPAPPLTRESPLWAAGEVGLIFLIFFLYGSSFPPDANEAHYLAKARHFWRPEWCRGDLFLESADAHLVFYWTFGWLTKFASLSAVAWTGRVITWLGLAWAWRQMSWTVAPVRGAAALAAGLFLVLIRYAAPGGEWVIGGVEAKGFAYILAFFALAALARGHWTTAWLAAGAAAAFHVLVGGWLLAMLAWAWLWSPGDRPALRPTILAGLSAVLLSLPGLLPALLLSSGVDRETVQEANRIYVYERLGHHLLFHRFDHLLIAAHVGLAVIWVLLCRQAIWPLEMRRLQRAIGGAVLLAALGVVIDQTTLHNQDLAAAILRYYWFRMSDALLPVGVALLLVAGVAAWHKSSAPAASWALVALLLIAGLNLADVCRLRNQHQLPPGLLLPRVSGRPSMRFFGGPQTSTHDDSAPDPAEVAEWQRLVKLHGEPVNSPLEQVAQDWLATCRWIATNTEANARFLTPRSQQTFKWYAQRPEVVSWKDVPQDARGLVQWYDTWNEVQPNENAAYDLCGFDDAALRSLARKHHAQYVVIDRTRSRRPLGLARVYPEQPRPSWFEVYQLPPDR